MLMKPLSVLGGSIAIGLCALVAAPVAFAESPSVDCAVVAMAAPGPNQASPIVGEACFATVREDREYAAATVAAQQLAATPTAEPFAPASSIHLAVSWSGTDGNGNRIDWYGGNGPCRRGGVAYAFENFSGWVNKGLKSDSQDTVTGAECLVAEFHEGPKLGGVTWDCIGEIQKHPNTNSCFPSMPEADLDRASSVTMHHG